MTATLAVTAEQHELALSMNDLREVTIALGKAQELSYRRLMQHQADIAKIGEALITQANDRDWCNVYDEVVDEINCDLNIELPIRLREYEVEVRVTYVTTVTVEARNHDEAREQVEGSGVSDLNLSDYDAEMDVTDVSQA